METMNEKNLFHFIFVSNPCATLLKNPVIPNIMLAFLPCNIKCEQSRPNISLNCGLYYTISR